MSRPWTVRQTVTGIEYGGTSSQYYWNEGLNPGASFDAGLNTYDLALPNCTTYAYGRILEAGDPAPISGWHNASAWHNYLINGWTYEAYSDHTVRQGDLVEWCTGGRNHVAVIEYPDGNAGIIYVSQSYYTDTSGGSSGYRDYHICGSTKASVSNWGLTNYPGRYFSYTSVYSAYGVAPDYILRNPNSVPDPQPGRLIIAPKRKIIRRIRYV